MMSSAEGNGGIIATPQTVKRTGGMMRLNGTNTGFVSNTTWEQAHPVEVFRISFKGWSVHNPEQYATEEIHASDETE